jgi:hypothetical protein
MPEIPVSADPTSPVPFYAQEGYEEALRAAQVAQGFAPDLPCGMHPRKAPVEHRGRGKE